MRTSAPFEIKIEPKEQMTWHVGDLLIIDQGQPNEERFFVLQVKDESTLVVARPL